MNDGLYVEIWVPRDGMTGTFDHLYKAWGLPHAWPRAVREVVCERRTAPLRWGESLNLLTGERA